MILYVVLLGIWGMCGYFIVAEPGAHVGAVALIVLGSLLAVANLFMLVGAFAIQAALSGREQLPPIAFLVIALLAYGQRGPNRYLLK
ncbi:hypothetical protein [Actinocorallia lasiicapitis]